MDAEGKEKNVERRLWSARVSSESQTTRALNVLWWSDSKKGSWTILTPDVSRFGFIPNAASCRNITSAAKSSADFRVASRKCVREAFGLCCVSASSSRKSSSQVPHLFPLKAYFCPMRVPSGSDHFLFPVSIISHFLFLSFPISYFFPIPSDSFATLDISFESKQLIELLSSCSGSKAESTGHMPWVGGTVETLSLLEVETSATSKKTAELKHVKMCIGYSTRYPNINSTTSQQIRKAKAQNAIVQRTPACMSCSHLFQAASSILFSAVEVGACLSPIWGLFPLQERQAQHRLKVWSELPFRNH